MSSAANQEKTSDGRQFAAASAHALNNVLAVLYAASSHLESPGDPRSLERARRAVDDACADALALSAALSLLSLGPQDVLGVPAGTQVLDAQDIERILDTLETAARATVSKTGLPQGALFASLDRDTLQSVLVCAAAALRRSVRRDAPLHCDATFVGGHEGGLAELVFELRSVAPAHAASAGSSRHPCAMAIEHIATLLPSLGAQLDLSTPGAASIRLEATSELSDPSQSRRP
jgi:hypothetical protein